MLEQAPYQIFLKFDESICDENNLNDMLKESTELFNVLEKCSVPLERKNADYVTNVYGRNLLELCKNNNLFILNGRIGQDRLCPKVTCKDRSTVDYILSTVGDFLLLLLLLLRYCPGPKHHGQVTSSTWLKHLYLQLKT